MMVGWVHVEVGASRDATVCGVAELVDVKAMFARCQTLDFACHRDWAASGRLLEMDCSRNARVALQH